MSGKKGVIAEIFGLALIAVGIFISVISFGVALPGGLTLISAGLTLIQGVQSAKALEQTGALQRSTPTADPSALGAFVFGTTIVPMNLVYEEITGSEPDRVLHDVYAHAWHRIQSYVSLTVATDTGPETVSFSGNAATGSYANLLWWFRADGTQTTALSGTPFDNNSWPSTAHFTGVAHSGLVWNIDDDNFKAKFSSIPTNVEAEVQGAWLYDPRLDPTYGSGSQDYGTPSSWGFNDGNAALVLLRGIIGEKSGSDLVWGRGAPETEINMASFITAANVADESLDGDVRYRLGGMWLLSGSFEEFVQQWEQETGGTLSKSGGQYIVWLPNDDLTPLTTITEADVVQGAAIQHTIAGGLENLYNTARGRYIDAANGYVGKPYAEVNEATETTADGGKRVLSQDFSWVQSESIAQRTARIRVRRSRFQRVWVVPMGWKGQSPNYAVFSVHTLNCLETNYSDQTVRVIDRKMSYMGLTVLTLQQEDVSIYDDTVTLNDPLAGNNVTSKTSQFGAYIAIDGRSPAAVLVEDPFFTRRAELAPYDGSAHPGYYWAYGTDEYHGTGTATIDLGGGSAADKGALILTIPTGALKGISARSLPTVRERITRGEHIKITFRVRRRDTIQAGQRVFLFAGRGAETGIISETFTAPSGGLPYLNATALSAMTVDVWYDFVGTVPTGDTTVTDTTPDADKLIVGVYFDTTSSTSNPGGTIEIDSIVAVRTASQQQLGLIMHPQSVAELAAPITPDDNSFPELYLRRYGGAPGSGDNTNAMNRALAVAEERGGGLIILDEIGEWRMNVNIHGHNIKIQMEGGDAQHDLNCIRPYSLSSAPLTFGDGTTLYFGCGIINCHISGTDGTSTAVAHNAPQALLISGGMIGFTQDENCILYSGVQTLAIVPSSTQPVSGSVIKGMIRNDCTGTADSRAIYLLGVSGTGYNTDNKFVSVKVNSTGSGYAAEIDGTGYGIYFELHAGGYWDIKPGLGILLKNSSIRSQGTQLDPGASAVVVVETTDTGIINLARLVSGLLIVDGQKWKNGTGTSYTFPTYANWFQQTASLLAPYIQLPIYVPTSTDMFSQAITIDTDTDTGPVTINGADWSVKTAGKGLRVKEGSNAKQGISGSMSGGSVTVSNTSVTSSSRIFVTRQPGGSNPGAHYVSTITAGTSFVITSTNGSDTGTSAYEIFEPA